MVTTKAGVFKLNGVIKNYDWGGTDFLPDLLSIPNPFKQPMAEYWLGAHASSPSLIDIPDATIALDKFIANNTEAALGKIVAKKFGQLPFLLKVLDVRDMLSIQVHPSKHVAEVEFANENKRAIPIDAPHRNYRDDNHKPELVVALNDFWLLHGFKTVQDLLITLESIPEFKPLITVFEETGYDQLYKTVMEMPQRTVNELLQPLLDRIIPLYQENKLPKDKEDFWAARAALTFDKDTIDRGIFSIYFFNLVRLRKGEGIFQDAGVPHAYLEGQCVEIMANSDNVLRGGLTNKHVDIRELMKNIKFEETIPHILLPERLNNEEVYRTGTPDFKLSRVQLAISKNLPFILMSPAIVLVIHGGALIQAESSGMQLGRGESAFICSGEGITITAESDVDIYLASVPVHSIE